MCFGKKRHVFCVTFALGALPPCWLWGGCVVTQCLDEGELEFRKGAAFSQGARSQTLKITISAKNLMMEETIFLSVALSNLVENAVCPGPWRCFFFFFSRQKRLQMKWNGIKIGAPPWLNLHFFMSEPTTCILDPLCLWDWDSCFALFAHRSARTHFKGPTLHAQISLLKFLNESSPSPQKEIVFPGSMSHNYV